MKKVICLAALALAATGAQAAEMKWTGSAGYRYEQTSSDGVSNLPATTRNKAHGFRANLGVMGGWENVEWGVGVRTSRGQANDDHVYATNATDFGVGIEQAWFRYIRQLGAVDLSVTLGRQKNVFAYDTVSQNFFDNDVRFDGLGWQFKFGMFGLNAAQYAVGGTGPGIGGASGASSVTSSDAANGGGQQLSYLFGVQPTMNWKFSDEIEAMFGVGYYYWSNSSNTNVLGGVNFPYVSPTNPGGLNAANTAGGYRFTNPHQWQFTTAWTLPYNLSFNGEFVKNKAATYNGALATSNPDVSSTAWSAGLTYGAIKKAHDFSVGYAYGSKGLASVQNQFTNEKFQADNKGHTIRASYALADNFTLGARAILTKEVEGLLPTGAAKGSTGSNNYWELTAGVLF